MFFIFITACRKYKFSFSLSAYNKFVITLNPNNSFENINIEQEFYNCSFIKLFLNAIKAMKDYRKERGY